MLIRPAQSIEILTVKEANGIIFIMIIKMAVLLWKIKTTWNIDSLCSFLFFLNDALAHGHAQVGKCYYIAQFPPSPVWMSMNVPIILLANHFPDNECGRIIILSCFKLSWWLLFNISVPSEIYLIFSN